jgi:hypothetical protein
MLLLLNRCHLLHANINLGIRSNGLGGCTPEHRLRADGTDPNATVLCNAVQPPKPTMQFIALPDPGCCLCHARLD